MIHFSKTHFKRFQMMQKSMQSNRFENFCNIPTLVNPSQRAMQKPNEAWVIINRTNGTVETAHCTCMAG